MKPDLIFANSPYGKPGIEITKYIMENFPDANYAMLNTRSAFKKYYDKLACQYATIGKYLLGTNENLHWVEQAILLATNGWTEVVDNRKKDCKNKVGMPNGAINPQAYTDCRTSHLVGTRISPVTNLGHITDHITEMCEVQGDMRGKLIEAHRVSHLVQLPRADTLGVAATHCRSTTLVQANKSDDTKLRNGYIYVAFETFEEACECAIDIISWTNPTDSHYRCVRWGFVTGLVSHERYKEEGEQK